MIHNHELWKHIHGFFDYQDVWELIVNRCNNGDWIVEIGCYLGKSTCCLGEVIHRSGKQINVICIDPWPLHWTADKRETFEPFAMFWANIRQSGWDPFIFPFRSTSKCASTIIRNDLAAVYIDGDHAYESVKTDILCWLPKVRAGGILAGHDYSTDWPDVIRAVNELLGGTFSLMGQSWVRNV